MSKFQILVKLSNNNGRIKLRVRPEGYPAELTKTRGIWENKHDMHLMRGIANDIEQAIANDTFTGHLDSYFPDKRKLKGLLELLAPKNSLVDKRLKKWLTEEGDIFTPKQCEQFFSKKGWTGATLKRYRGAVGSVAPHLIKGIESGGNSQGDPFPFLLNEQMTIKEYFSKTEYGWMVAFWLATGLRTGELKAIGDSDFIMKDGRCYVAINKRISQGVLLKGTKNGKNRLVPISNELFIKRELPLPSVRYFCDRKWKEALDELGIEYRKPYCIRHTAISTHLHRFGKPLDTSLMFGTGIRMIEKHYGGQVGDIDFL